MGPLLLQKAGRGVRFASMLAVAAGALLFAGASHAQENQPTPSRPQPVVQTFFLKNATSVNDLNDVQTDLRNVLSRARIYGVSTENAITVSGTPEDLTVAQKLIAELDRPKKIYRVTYTIAELDGGKHLSSRSVSVLVSEHGKGTLRLGTRVPIVTGSTGSAANLTSEVQYIDVGLNLEASAYGSELRTKVEQTSMSDEKSTAGIQDPVIRQTVVEGTSPLGSGRSVNLGSMDMPGSTHQQQISVSAEPLPQQE